MDDCVYNVGVMHSIATLLRVSESVNSHNSRGNIVSVGSPPLFVAC